MLAPIWFTNFFHESFPVLIVEKENKFFIGPKQAFFQFAGVFRNKSKQIIVKKLRIRDLRFEIREDI